MQRSSVAVLFVCVFAFSLLTGVTASPNVLEWLGNLPFPASSTGGVPQPGSFQQVALGEKHVPTAPKTIDPSNPPLPAPVGTILSDTFQYSPIRRGLIAQKEFKNNTEILKVHFQQMFNYSSPIAPDVPLPHDFSELILTSVHTGAVLDSQALLALRLLLQYQNHHEWKKSASEHANKLHWDSFLSDLPKPSSVCFFTQEELAELQIPIESPVFAARSQQLDTITESFLAFEELLKSKVEYANLFPSGFTEKWYRWAYGIVLNTAVEVPIRDEDGVQGALLVLIPALNHLNHANPPYNNARLQWNEAPYVKPTDGSKHAIGSTGTLSLVASRDIRQGEEITITYGSLSAIPLLVVNEANKTHDGQHKHESVETHTSRDKHHNDTNESHFTRDSFFQQVGLSNSQLLVHYGLALPANEIERVALDIGLDTDTVGVEEHHYDILELKKQIIDLNELDHGTLIGLDGRLDPYFIQALRTKHLTAEDLAHLSGNEYEFSPENGYLSLQNELKWQLQLVVSVENLLTAYPTTLHKDLGLIKDLLDTQGRSAHGNNLLHAFAYRASLKRVLHALILRSLQNIHELFLSISTAWSEQLHKHNLEEEAELKQHLDLTPEAKKKLMDEWTEEQRVWFKQMEEWKIEMDKWEGQWHQWVQNAVSASKLLDTLPQAPLHPHATPETLDEMLDPSIHALQLEHEEEEVTVDVEDSTPQGAEAMGDHHADEHHEEAHGEEHHEDEHEEDAGEEEEEHDEL